LVGLANAAATLSASGIVLAAALYFLFPDYLPAGVPGYERGTAPLQIEANSGLGSLFYGRPILCTNTGFEPLRHVTVTVSDETHAQTFEYRQLGPGQAMEIGADQAWKVIGNESVWAAAAGYGSREWPQGTWSR
jgi:hypothetical protein